MKKFKLASMLSTFSPENFKPHLHTFVHHTPNPQKLITHRNHIHIRINMATNTHMHTIKLITENGLGNIQSQMIRLHSISADKQIKNKINCLQVHCTHIKTRVFQVRSSSFCKQPFFNTHWIQRSIVFEARTPMHILFHFAFKRQDITVPCMQAVTGK